jgi:hypothetical protein
VGRDEARHAAADELAKPAYAHARPSLTKRVMDWTGHELSTLWHKAFSGGTGGGGWIGLLVVLALLVAVVVLIRLRYGPVRRRVTAEKALFDEAAPLDAAGYRRVAEEHAAGGRWAEAVRARLRAVIAALEERAVLEPRPGRTADVAAREAGALLPGQAPALLAAARVFDDIWYGETSAGPEDYRRLVEVDEAVAAARVRVPAGVGLAAGGAGMDPADSVSSFSSFSSLPGRDPGAFGHPREPGSDDSDHSDRPDHPAEPR